MTLKGIANDFQSPQKIKELWSSFSILRERTVYFVHQSAKDLIVIYVPDKISSSGEVELYYTIVSKTFKVMSCTLQHDMYNLRAPGFAIDPVPQPELDLFSCGTVFVH